MTKLADKMLEDEEAMECSVCLETGASTALIPWCVIVQKRPIHMAKEAYSYGKRDLFIWQKRPSPVANEDTH